ncbi:hypothetical protein B566_EDAN012572 [Ephemera danica]|nr:hypothetical protein B566_EDAN012572 [Ephemera danica]
MRVSLNQKTCYIPYDGKEFEFKEFEFLVIRSIYKYKILYEEKDAPQCVAIDDMISHKNAVAEKGNNFI